MLGCEPLALLDSRSIVYIIDTVEHPLWGESVVPEEPLSSIVRVSVARWDETLTPWPVQGPVLGGRTFSGGGQETRLALMRAIEAFESEAHLAIEARFLAGYSLAGLFSLWAWATSDAFYGCASVSGSLWYEGWLPWLQAEASRPGFSAARPVAYLSYGTKEPRAKNPILKQVGSATQTSAEILRAAGVNTSLTLEAGGHFFEPGARMRRALSALMVHSPQIDNPK